MTANEGRGYVLRRVVRRAIRHGHKLGAKGAFFFRLVDPLIAEMWAAYPELGQFRDRIVDALRTEEDRFAETLEHGLRILDQDLATLKGDTVPGSVAFKLSDTYGFPIDLTRDIAMERSLKVDMAGYEKEMEKQRERARAASRFDAGYHKAVVLDHGTEFTGYENTDDVAHVTELYVYGSDDVAIAANEMKSDDVGILVLDRTPFYAESGGQ